MALLLIFSYLMFLFNNFFSYLLAPAALIASYGPPSHLGIKEQCFVPLSSAVLISGLALLFFYLRGRNASPEGARQASEAQGLVQAFTSGLLWASLLLGGYLVLQFISGFEYREIGWKLPPAEQFANGFFRARGFFGHPLSLAGVSLAIFSCYLRLACERWEDRGFALRCVLISLVHFVGIVLSGGRAALCVGVVLLLLVPYGCGVRGRSRARQLLLLSAMGVGVGALAWVSGIVPRFVELLVQLAEGAVDRFKFWQVYLQMICDRPWTGHGSALVKYFSRDLYYQELGFASLTDKYNAHNIYLEVLANVGIIGFVFLFATVWYVHCQLRGGEKGSVERCFWQGSVLALGANALFGVTQNTFFDANVLYIHLAFFWLVFWMQKGRQSLYIT